MIWNYNETVYGRYIELFTMVYKATNMTAKVPPCITC